MSEEKKIIREAVSWFQSRVNKNDVGNYVVSWKRGMVVFEKSKKYLTDDDVIYVANNSNDVSKAWRSYPGDDMIRVQYTNSTFNNISQDDILREEWFCLSLKWMLVCNLVNLKMETVEFAQYHPIFPYHSKIDFNKLEFLTGKSFEFERNFNKPKNKIYATVEI